MTQGLYKLLLEKPIVDMDLEVLVEEKNSKDKRDYYITGPYLMFGRPNRNKRRYNADEMINEVRRYTTDFISTNRALGELNHPENSAEVDLKNACHKVMQLEQRGDFFYGKSKILSTPSGEIARCLLTDGIKLGISSRALGCLEKDGDINNVRNLRIIAMDLVHEPSVENAMMESILESKNYLIDQSGKIMEVALNALQSELSKLPIHERSQYVTEAFSKFFKSLRATNG